MPKRKSRKNSDKSSTSSKDMHKSPTRKTSKIPKTVSSNALAPARVPGEEVDLSLSRPVVKQETLEYNPESETQDQAYREIFSFVTEARNNAVLPRGGESGRISDHSTLPMEMDERTVLSKHGSGSASLVENQPLRVNVKQEPELSDNQPGCFNTNAVLASSNDKSPNKVSSPIVNGQVKTEPLNNGEFSQNFTYEDSTNAGVCIKKESLDDTAESRENINQLEKPAKRKPDFEEELEIIRKRIKTEPVADSPNFSGQVDNCSQDMQTDDNQDNDIAVLPVEEKSFPLISLLSDDEDDKSESENVASSCNMNSDETSNVSLQAIISTSDKKIVQQDFSTDILRYFNVASELDRSDIQAALDHMLVRYNNKSNLAKFFPTVKTESKPKRVIKKGDILFRKEVRANYDTGSVFNITHKLAIQPTAELTSQNSSFQNPSISQSTQLLSPFHVSKNFEINTPPNSQTAISPSTLNLNVEESFPGPSKEELANILRPFHNGNDLTSNENDKAISLQDPRCKNSLFNLENASSVKVDNIAVVAPEIPSPPVVQSSIHNFQRLSSSPSTARAPLELPSSSSAILNRDPRLASRSAAFPGRKGERDLLLYHNVGKDDVTNYFEKLVLQWNPEWLEIQQHRGAIPPICVSYPSVSITYSNEFSYFNTYVPLHLLHVWFKLYKCWSEKTGTVINCQCQCVERSDDRFEITCVTELDIAEKWPKNDDIALCRHNGEEAFIRVEDVKKKPKESSTRLKLKISLESRHDLQLRAGDTVQFCILINIRIECLEAKALKSLDSGMKDVVVKPAIFANCIEVYQLVQDKPIKEQRNAILKAADKDYVRVVVTLTYHCCDVVGLMALLTFSLAFKQKNENRNPTKVLICIKNEDTFERLVRRLLPYKPILAVRTKQISLDPQFLSYALEVRLERRENLNDILATNNIFITTFSAFGSAEKAQLSRLNKLTCIIESAHLCTEAETALPLTLKLNKLLLIGDRTPTVFLPQVLEKYNYNSTLFFRLLKAKGVL